MDGARGARGEYSERAAQTCRWERDRRFANPERAQQDPWGCPMGIDGTDVERYFLEGKVKEIAHYCDGGD
jgi:hypothetical protein